MANSCPICGNPVDPSAYECSSCGFKLPGATQSFKPIAIGEEERKGFSRQRHKAVLQVVRGPQIGMAYALTDKAQTVGRSPQCDIFLNDMTVSRLHASVMSSDEGYVIADENSYNGLWVNNQSVESAILKPGDLIQIGSFSLVYDEQ